MPITRGLSFVVFVGVAAAATPDSRSHIELALAPVPILDAATNGSSLESIASQKVLPSNRSSTPWKPAGTPSQAEQAVGSTHQPGQPLRIVASSDTDKVKIDQWRQIADKAKRELQEFGGLTNATILPYGTAHMEVRGHVDKFPERQVHDILGESEDPGGWVQFNSTGTPSRRGKEWRRALAAKVNEEHMDKWRQAEAVLLKTPAHKWQRAPSPVQTTATPVQHV